MSLQNFIYVSIGGTLGSCFRYFIGRLMPFDLSNQFPWPTFIVNILGSFLIGVLYTFLQKNQVTSTQYVLLATGLMGGFTTFSAMSLEAVVSIKAGHLLMPLTYILSSIVFGISAVWIGMKMVA